MQIDSLRSPSKPLSCELERSDGLFRGRGRVRPQRSEGVGRKGHPTAAKRREACPTGAVRTTVRTGEDSCHFLIRKKSPTSSDVEDFV